MDAMGELAGQPTGHVAMLWAAEARSEACPEARESRR